MADNKEKELPAGQIAADLIDLLQKNIVAKRDEIRTLEGAIEGVKMYVLKLQEHADKEETVNGKSN